MQNEGGEVGAVGDEAAAKSSEEPSAEAEENEEQEETDESAERREIVKMSDPREPSEDERRERNLTHLPFRSWRPHCVRGRGREADHRRYKEQAVGLHECTLISCKWKKKINQDRPSQYSWPGREEQEC